MAKLLNAKDKDLGGFTVKRLLPHAEQRTVGPFVFLDHMGPAHFSAGNGINVRPHPHIGLATMTYLFDGSILHRDSLGTIQEIFPGDVNWMTAGKGIVHSERETIEVRANDHTLNGLQCWIALPPDKAEIDPSFVHVPKSHLPYIHKEKILMRLIAGEAFNKSSPVKTYSSMFYIDVVAEKGATIGRPCGDSETALYMQQGEIEICGQTYTAGDFIFYELNDDELKISENARFVFLGGEPLPRAPHMVWNFVSFDKEKIDDAKQKWSNGEFPRIPGDDDEFIPFPD